MKGRGKAPAFQWFPGDHRRDTAVQACSFEARALWREMLDLMHDGKPYGHLTAGGVPIEPERLARIVGITPQQAKRWMRELEEREVFSRTDAGVIYSRRMVKDEYLRQVRAKSGAKGGNPMLLMRRSGSDLDNQENNHRPNQSDEQNPTPAVAVASASANNPPPPVGASGREVFLASLPQSQRRDRWEAEIAAWRDGLNLQRAATDADIDQALSDYLLSPNRDYSPVHVRRFVQRATSERLRQAAGIAGVVRAPRGRRPTPQQYASYDTSGNDAALAEFGVPSAEATA